MHISVATANTCGSRNAKLRGAHEWRRTNRPLLLQCMSPFMTQLGHRFVQAATACRTADLRNFSALGVKQQPLTRPARLMVMRAAVSHSSIEIPAANTAIARCSAGFRSAHEILFIACPRDGFRLFFELLPYNYSHTVSDSLSVENDRLVTLHGLFRAVEPHKGIFLSTVALPCLNPSSHL